MVFTSVFRMLCLKKEDIELEVWIACVAGSYILIYVLVWGMVNLSPK